MHPRRALHRRSFLRRVIGGSIASAGSFILVGGGARGQVRTGITDADSGANYDPPGFGRGGNRSASQAGSPQGSTGVTDADAGAGADPAGRGRGGNRSAPQAGSPQGSTGVTDADAGPGADPGGRGRGGVRPPSSGQPPTDCVSHRVRLNSLEALTERPDGWSEERLARARTEMQAIRRYLNQELGDPFDANQIDHIQTMARAHGITTRDIQNNQEWRGNPLGYLYQQIAGRIDQAVAATAQRSELHRQIDYHRSVLAAAGCR